MYKFKMKIIDCCMLNVMNIRLQIFRGNKLFLLKIEYVKFFEDRLFCGERFNVQLIFVVGEKSNVVFENGEKIFLLN